LNYVHSLSDLLLQSYVSWDFLQTPVARTMFACCSKNDICVVEDWYYDVCMPPYWRSLKIATCSSNMQTWRLWNSNYTI